MYCTVIFLVLIKTFIISVFKYQLDKLDIDALGIFLNENMKPKTQIQ